MREYHNNGLTISTDPARLQPDEIHAFLSRSYWASGRSRERIDLSLRSSLCFGLYDGGRQIGLARVVTDYGVFAYLCDVYVLEEYRGRGVGKWLIGTVLAYPELQDVGRWILGTLDAHELYRQFGFTEPRMPERQMELLRK